MADIAATLRGWCTDWNGANMVRGEPPRDGLHCDALLDAAVDLWNKYYQAAHAALKAALSETDVKKAPEHD